MLGMCAALTVALLAASPLPALIHAAPQSTFARDSGTGNCSQPPIAMSWFANWEGSSSPPFTVQNINWTQYTTVSYAFLEPAIDQSIPVGEYDGQLRQFVEAARSNNVNATVTVGGWTGSRYFSSAVATDQNRSALADAAVTLVETYRLDGLDFDWEYPSGAGIGCNQQSPDDAANYLLFLQELRERLPFKTLSAAVGLKPFPDASGFYDVLDYAELMAYDVWGSWSPTVGPNSPLADACAPPGDQQGSAASAVAAWQAAGFRADKLVLGVAGYGHSFRVTPVDAYTSAANRTLALYPAFDGADPPTGDSWDTGAPGTTTTDECGNEASSVTGIVNYWGLYQQGFLNASGLPADGVDYVWDPCSATPYVYKSDTRTMVSYDDVRSLGYKGEYVTQAGLRGWALWEASSDYDNVLVEALRAPSVPDCSQFVQNVVDPVVDAVMDAALL